jgi:hypothetical protein
MTSRDVQKVIAALPTEEIKRVRQQGLMSKRGIPEKLPKKGFCPSVRKKSPKTRPTDKERPKILPYSERSLPPGGAARCKKQE